MANTKNDVSFVRSEMVQAVAPPSGEIGVVGWMKKNLFSSTSNTILTLIGMYLLYLVVPGTLSWGVFDAVWSGENRLACATVAQGGELPDGWKAACWPYVGAYFKLFIYGRYPDAELWRVNLVLFMFFVGLVPLLMPSLPYKRENLIFMLGIFPVASFVLLSGGNLSLNGFLLPEAIMAPSTFKFWVDFIILSLIVCGLVGAYMKATETDPRQATSLWGGFVMTLVIAVTGIVAALPLGILLALGVVRKCRLVSLFSVIFIEFWRGIPLITVLFMSSVMLPLFLPDGVTFDKLLRALIGVALFSSAYMAEVVRGGMQAIPKGQYEGAMAVGLNYWQSMRMIILPQALKIVIPGIVNTFIGLFKDTTLVSIIGLLDFLGMINLSHSDSNWATPSPDDLKQIKGVGPKLEGVLNGLGVYTYDQVARWKKSEVEWVDDHLKFKGRIDRDEWIPQCKKMAKASPNKAGAKPAAKKAASTKTKTSAASKAGAKAKTASASSRKAPPKSSCCKSN
ncbi:General L-amino acid transport system permease protein AapM [Nymphon striatum]|nr:General L-amino acid transport system permease protein AapM [Nymphon striatum]